MPGLRIISNVGFALVASVVAFSGLAEALSLRAPQGCPPFSGTFNVSRYRVYPENLDWDSIHCKLYLGALHNQSILVYDPYTKAQNVLTFPGISGNDTFHMSGVDFDARTGSMYFSANAAAPFTSSGKNVTGPNFLIKYDTKTEKVAYIADMAPATAELSALAGQPINGYQDMAEDLSGNSYYLVTIGNAITKVTPSGAVSVFYSTPRAELTDPPAFGFGGLCAIGDKLVVGSNSPPGFFTFDTTSSNPTATPLPVSNVPANYTIGCDDVYLPTKYAEKVIMCSDDNNEAIAIYRSSDCWKSAQFLGLVPNNNPLVKGGLPTATVEIAQSLYISNDFTSDEFANPTSPNPFTRAVFPLIDITSQVDALVAAAEAGQ